MDLVNGLTLVEVRDDLTVEDIVENTGCAFKVITFSILVLFNLFV